MPGLPHDAGSDRLRLRELRRRRALARHRQRAPHRRQRQRSRHRRRRQTSKVPSSSRASSARAATRRTAYVGKWLTYAYGRIETTQDACTRASLQDAFAASGGNIKQLMVALTQTDAFLYGPRRPARRRNEGGRRDHVQESNSPSDAAARRRRRRDRAPVPRCHAAPRAHASAADTTPMRLVVFYSPGGTLLDKWRPTGASRQFHASSMMSPLTPMKDRLLFVDGLEPQRDRDGLRPSARPRDGRRADRAAAAGRQLQHQPGKCRVRGRGIDRSGHRGADLDRTEVQEPRGLVRLVDRASRRAASPTPAASSTTRGSNVPIPPATDPLNTFSRVFAGVGGDAAGQARDRLDTSILDSVMEDYRYLSAKLGPSGPRQARRAFADDHRGTKRPQGDGQGQLRGADRHQSDARVLQRRGGRFDQPRRSRRRQGRHPGRRQGPGKGARDDRHPGRRAGLRRHPRRRPCSGPTARRSSCCPS